MDGDNDNGYHSSDNNDTDGLEDVAENVMFQGLNYTAAETELDEPDYEALREERFKRNQDAMEVFDPRIAHSMPFSGDNYLPTTEEIAAVVIQKHVRGFLAQRKYVDLLMEQFEKEEKLRRQKTLDQMEEAKLLIENHQLEVQFEEYNVARKNKTRRLICCAITIQRAWRRHLARKRDSSCNQAKIIDADGYDIVVTQLVEHAIQSALSELMHEKDW